MFRYDEERQLVREPLVFHARYLDPIGEVWHYPCFLMAVGLPNISLGMYNNPVGYEKHRLEGE
jgi:hypothetical protein